MTVSEQHLVRIHINRAPVETPTPTTGEQLYGIAGVAKHEKLFREIVGDQEDEKIVCDEMPIDLAQDTHFYSQKSFDILVNGDDHEIDTATIDYKRVVDLYLGSGGTPSNEFLVKYSHGPAENQKGTLAPGQKVKVKDDMRFRVAGTGES